jgi:hypothetical protein
MQRPHGLHAEENEKITSMQEFARTSDGKDARDTVFISNQSLCFQLKWI